MTFIQRNRVLCDSDTFSSSKIQFPFAGRPFDSGCSVEIEVKLCFAVKRSWLIIWPSEVTSRSNSAAWQRRDVF